MAKKIKNKKSATKKEEQKITKLYFVFGGILIVLLFGLILYANEVFEPEHEVIHVQILDECAPVLGNLIHNINDDGDCKIKCVNNCNIRELDFYDSEFILQNASCHTCNCYCK